MKSMKIVFISDTHTLHNSVTIPECDILLHTGDFTNHGGIISVEHFINWFGKQPAKFKVFIAGNHDMTFDKNHLNYSERTRDSAFNLIHKLNSNDANIFYLENNSVIINGLHIYGSPITPEFHAWGFNVQRGQPIADIWAKIPDTTDILLTHGPPYSHLDHTWEEICTGCEDLLNRVNQIKPKIHAFGHIHESYGYKEHNDIVFINSSIMDYSRVLNVPIVVTIDDNKQIIDITKYET